VVFRRDASNIESCHQKLLYLKRAGWSSSPMATTGSISKAEKSYIQAALQASLPSRADGRSLLDYRAIALETGVAPLANGSARVNIGKHGGQESGSGTEVLAAVKLEVEDAYSGGDGVDGGRIVCSVSWFVQYYSSFVFDTYDNDKAEHCKDSSPAAYPHLSSAAVDDLSYDMTTVLHQSLSHSSLHPPNLGIIPRKKSWLLNLDIMVLSDSGNIYDALFMAARSALWDTKVPRTRSVQYQVKKKSNNGSGAVASTGEHDLDMDEQESPSGFVTRQINNVADFDLPDYWDEGEPLGSRDQWPVCVTLNLVCSFFFLLSLSTVLRMGISCPTWDILLMQRRKKKHRRLYDFCSCSPSLSVVLHICRPCV
jgi:exosome complex component RRP42